MMWFHFLTKKFLKVFRLDTSKVLARWSPFFKFFKFLKFLFFISNTFFFIEVAIAGKIFLVCVSAIGFLAINKYFEDPNKPPNRPPLPLVPFIPSFPKKTEEEKVREEKEKIEKEKIEKEKIEKEKIEKEKNRKRKNRKRKNRKRRNWKRRNWKIYWALFRWWWRFLKNVRIKFGKFLKIFKAIYFKFSKNYKS